MNENPELEEIDGFLENWRTRSIAQMQQSRSFRKDKLDSGSREDWEWLTDRKIVTLSFK